MEGFPSDLAAHWGVCVSLPKTTAWPQAGLSSSVELCPSELLQSVCMLGHMCVFKEHVSTFGNCSAEPQIRKGTVWLHFGTWLISRMLDWDCSYQISGCAFHSSPELEKWFIKTMWNSLCNSADFFAGTLTQAIRNFAKSLEGWLMNAMSEFPSKIVQTKVSGRNMLQVREMNWVCVHVELSHSDWKSLLGFGYVYSKLTQCNE